MSTTSAALPHAQAPAKSLPIFIVSCIAFFALGMITAAIGPALGDLSRNTGATLASLGSLFTGLFLGSLISQTAAGPAQDRFGPRPVLLIGLALVGLGTIGITLTPTLAMAFAISVIAGFGHGAVDVTTNVLAGELYPHRRAAVINLVNVFFGVGAFLGPALAGLTLRLWGTALPSLWIGGGLMLPLIPLMAAWAPAQAVPLAAGDHATHDFRAVLRSPRLWLMGALILVYVGIENGTGGWTPTYLERTASLPAATAALVTSGFWGAITVGRIAAAFIGARLSSSRLLAASLSVALAGALLIGSSQGSAPLTTAGVVLMGIGFGPIFPTTIAIVTAFFRGSAGTAASIVVAMGGLGGMLLPWVQGQLLEFSGPTATQIMTVTCAALMLALFALAARKS